MGVFPLPPQVKFPTLITGTGKLNLQCKTEQQELNVNFLYFFIFAGTKQGRKRNYVVTGGYERSGDGKGSGEVRERVCREQRQRKGKGAESSGVEITY
ncbi:hypothetical protein SESBI_01493 [Sesbania bispinosa]|nr:hypothetical protein SESBI_01493 [Sesbania bispinosa]